MQKGGRRRAYGSDLDEAVEGAVEERVARVHGQLQLPRPRGEPAPRHIGSLSDPGGRR